ncbi:sensor histidine kinase [Streptomyces camelliae]|uniref:histidine kinase n=1 Tax=Streptomyces camelliae TaxID=3004093 RepID=A0ABY7NUR2_9ACTN|nr:sensor histidine kinase [Streptomyces sp. HUAS 2-6]WBO61955.1 sensor histidine kinase [Streptomyces sp. HUAS 2-6]
MNTSWQRRAAARPRAVEAAGLILLFAGTVGGVFLTRAVMPEPPAAWPGIALSAVACAALYRRRTHPLHVLGVTTLCTMAEAALGYLMTLLLMGPLLVAQYVTNLRTPRRTAWNSALAAAAGMVVTGVFHTTLHHSLILAVVNPVAWVLLCAALGSYIRVRREYAAARAEHADRQREEEARHRVIQERMRIARELHDVVAHHLTLADAQAGTAAHLARTHPDQALEIIAKLPETTAAALRELKATVGLLRQDTDPADDLAPAPGLRHLPDLVDACAAAGLDVTVTVEGRARRLTPVLDLTAYRIIQEALTNATKHAATRAARVRLSYTSRFLTLTIANDTAPGRPTATAGSGGGFGLLSMRERATSAGGTFQAGHRPHGGFEVACSLPLDPHDDSLDESTAP